MFVKLPKWSWYDSRGHALDCPKCGTGDVSYLHMVDFHKYDDESISIKYFCELCHQQSVLNLEQGKGVTYVYWEK